MVNIIGIGDDDGFLYSFITGSGGKFVNNNDPLANDLSIPISFRGITKRNLIKSCWENQRPFYFMDTGYFANYATETNPKAVKRWHRIVKNNVQHLGPVEDRPGDRWENLKKEFPTLAWKGWKKQNKSILIVTPSEKPCKFYGINVKEWVNDTIDILKKYTDRPIIVREKAPLRIDRSLYNTIYEQFDKDNVFALVTYNSIAATEAIAYGIPAFTLAPNAASPMCLTDLSKIETPYYPETDKVYKWCCYLSYGQFNNEELRDGTAWRILNEYN